MKTKFLFVAALCCTIMFACKSNEPDNQGNNNGKQETQELARLGNLIEVLGNVVSTQTQTDGSVIMKDDKDNTIIQDKEGNITITTKQGETITIDNSIKEDTSAPKDKWYNSTWKNNTNRPDEPTLYEDIPYFVENIQRLGFQVEQQEIYKDEQMTEEEAETYYTVHFNYTTGSLQQRDTTVKYTYTRSNKYLKIKFFPEEIGDGEERYELVIEGGYAKLLAKYYRYDYETENYVLEGADEREGLYRYEIQDDNSIYLSQGYEIKNSTQEITATKASTTFFNYRRLSDTQLAASNNSVSYILKEDNEDATPELDIYDLEGNYLTHLELVSL